MSLKERKRSYDRVAAAGDSRCACQLRLIYEICLSSFHAASRSAAVPELWTFGQNACFMKKVLPNRIVRLEGDLWQIRSDQGELDAVEMQELRDYFDEIRLPYKIEHGQLCASGSILWETLYEGLAHFYDGRAEVFPF